MSSSGKMSFQVLCLFLTGLFLLLLRSMSSLWILDIAALSDNIVYKFFLPIQQNFSFSWLFPFMYRNVLVWHSSIYLYSSCMWFWCHSKSHWQDQRQVFLDIFTVSHLTFKSSPFWIDFLLFKGSILFFCRWVSSFPNTIYWRYCPFHIVSWSYLCIADMVSVG